jgi:hypothetical protein
MKSQVFTPRGLLRAGCANLLRAAVLALLSAPLEAQLAPGPRVGVGRDVMRSVPMPTLPAARPEGSVAPMPDSRLCWDCDRRRQPFVSFLEMQLGMWPQWSVNKFVREGGIGDVNPAFWWRNVRGVWEWDPNSFDINQLGHPGQGSMYYNGWRTNGYGFWGSQLATLGGSFFWECCGERNLPSNNDLLTTWIGGATLGEVGRRLSDLWLDNSLRGGQRFRHEAAAFAVNPVRGFDRIFRGHAWRVGPNPPDAKPEWLQGVVGLGGVVLGSQRPTDNATLGGAKFAARLMYGTVDDAVGKPFDHFELEAELTSVPDAALYMIRSRGSLFGKHFRPDSSLLLWGALRYDYVRSRAFELGQQSFVLALERHRIRRDNFVYDAEFTLRAVPIAAIEDDFITPFGENRNYDYAYGGGYGGGGRVVWKERAMLRWNSIYEALRVADGEASSHIVVRHELYSQYQLGKNYGLGLGLRHQSRRTFVSPGVQSSARAPEVWVTLLRATPEWRY